MESVNESVNNGPQDFREAQDLFAKKGQYLVGSFACTPNGRMTRTWAWYHSTFSRGCAAFTR
jgi:hypothetical protein